MTAIGDQTSTAESPPVTQYDIQMLHGSIVELQVRLHTIKTMLDRITPLVEYAEHMLNSTPTQRLRAALKK
jgi:hypothetical protein